MEGEEVPNTPPPIRECFFASEEGLLREHYELGWLEIEAEDLTTFCHAIPILEVEGKVLIAVPEPAWHRTVARRFLPRMALTKAILVEVAAEETEALDSLDAPGTLRVWVGLLNPVMEPTFNAGDCDEPGVQGFVDGAGVPRLPAAQGLYAVAIEHFAFVTATSGQAAPGRAATMKGKQKGGDLEKRMLHLETTLEDIKGMLSQPSTKGYQERTQPATAAPLPPAPRALGLDPGVYRAATEAGVPEEHLRKLGAILQRPNRMTEGARATVPRNRNVLSESEEEGEAVEELAGAAEPKEPIEQAVVQLTKLVSLMHKKKSSRGGLEGILDRVDSGGTGGGEGSIGQPSGGRSKAAIYAKLKDALLRHPAWISQAIEQLMDEDFNTFRSQPGASQTAITSRAWVEHRSRIGHYPSTIRAAWLISGIHDSLRQQDVEQARARCCLALAAIDQSAVDAGSWTLAQEYLLELPPPYGSFVQRRPIDPSEQQATRLVDDRFLEVMMWRLKDRDSFHESKKRLSASSKARSQPGGEGEAARGAKTPKAAPKVKQKPVPPGRPEEGN